MASINTFECPRCGGAMEFDSSIQKISCPYCGTAMSAKEYEESAEPSGGLQYDTGAKWSLDEQKGMKVYSCSSCGGEIIAESTTAASSCPFCGNKLYIKEQLSGDFRPDCIIPFALDKKAAIEAYRRHISGRKFLPKVFKKQNHIDEIKGIYVPFWIFDVDAKADIRYKGEKNRVFSSGDTEYTETTEYNISRSGSISFEHIPTDASLKMDDALMESLEPFDFSGAVPFKTAYLAAYMADRYDVDEKRRLKRAKERIRKSAEDVFRETVTGYDAVFLSESKVNILNSCAEYALYPVWILNTSWKGEKFTFAMNGQTGKIVGNLPVDKTKYLTWTLLIGATLSGIIGGFLTWLTGLF